MKLVVKWSNVLIFNNTLKSATASKYELQLTTMPEFLLESSSVSLSRFKLL